MYIQYIQWLFQSRLGTADYVLSLSLLCPITLLDYIFFGTDRAENTVRYFSVFSLP
jgi:hypothetical protein